MNSLLSLSMMVLYSVIIDHGVLLCSRLVMATLNIDLATANLENGTRDFPIQICCIVYHSTDLL